MARKDPRYGSGGQVYIAEVENPEVLIKNLSATGLCLESKSFMDVIPKTRYSVDIVPEANSDLGKFSLEIESRWIRTKKNFSESGFVIVIPPGSPGHKALKEYLDYLDSQGEPVP